MNQTADVRQLHAESRLLMTATLVIQQRLSKARQAVHEIERKLSEISAQAAHAAAENKRALIALEQRRELLLADKSLGVDVSGEITDVDQKIAGLAPKSVDASDLAKTRVGLLVRHAQANAELSDASREERKSRLSLLTLLEEQEAAAAELVVTQYVNHLVVIQALASLRKAYGIDGLVGNEVLIPKASVSRGSSVVRLGASELRARVDAELGRLIR